MSPSVLPVSRLLRGTPRKLRFAIGMTVVFSMTSTVTPSPVASTMTIRGTLTFHRAAPSIQSIEELKLKGNCEIIDIYLAIQCKASRIFCYNIELSSKSITLYFINFIVYLL